MKIFNYLNVSNPSNLEADSGFVFQRLLMEAILKKRPEWRFVLLCPEGTPIENPNVEKIEMLRDENKYKVRFNFEWEMLQNTLWNIIDEIDVFLVNQSEQTPNMYSLVHTISERREIPFVTYFHYIPLIPPHVHFDNDIPNITTYYEYDNSINRAGLAEIVLMRQAEAVQLSRYSVSCSNFGKKLLEYYLKKANVEGNHIIINPPVSLDAVANLGTLSPEDGKKILVYNHRLYQHYGTKEFFEFMTHFYNTVRKDFEIIITDPTHGRSKERDRLSPDVSYFRETLGKLPFVRFSHRATQEDYFKLISTAHLGMGPMKTSALWSMSVVDVMACGKPVLCPKYASFPEIVDSDDLLYESHYDLEKKLNQLLDDNNLYRELGEYCRNRARLYDASYTADRFIEIFEDVAKR